VLGALSAALIILLTTLLVKRVSGNRTTEIVEMRSLGPQSEVRDRAGNCTKDDDNIYSNIDEIIWNNDEIVYNLIKQDEL
jgi:hypothetical protein